VSLTTAVALTVGFSWAIPAVAGAVHDGNWSVLVITEKGACDRGFRYSVAVANGKVRYRGDTSVNFNGTVEPSGAVKVSIRIGEQGANGTGRLTANGGTGTWRSVGKGADCAGRWEAERR
jgi:hypothetical protein